jgi:hypothetical protein
MAFPVHFDVVLGRRSGLLTSRWLGRRRWSGTASGNVPAANRGRVTAAALLPTALRKRRHAD